MTDLVRGEANTATNPRVVFGWQPPVVLDPVGGALKAGFFQPMDAVTFRILAPDGTEVIAPTAVDLGDPTNFLDTDARLVVLPFMVGLSDPLGAYTAEVSFVAHPTGGVAMDPQTVSWQFRVLDEGLGRLDTFAQLADMLDQGFPVGEPAPIGGYTLTQARSALTRATALVREITGRSFVPEYLVLDLDGQGGGAVTLPTPICGLTRVSLSFSTFSPADLPITEGDVRIYNRHIRQRLVAHEDDDRQDPRIEFLKTPNYSWPRGDLMGETDLLAGHTHFVESSQNVQVAGVYGYTDWDGSPFGKTPDLIREVTLRLAARYIQPLWQQVGGAGALEGAAGPRRFERTLDQAVEYANFASQGYAAYAGAFTGDPEIDQILAMYMAPPVYRSA